MYIVKFENVCPTMINVRFINFLFIILFGFSITVYSKTEVEHKNYVKFFLVLQTLKPLELNTAVLYYSPSRGNLNRDSVVISHPNALRLSDSLIFESKFKYPTFLRLKLSFNDLTRASRTFQCTGEVPVWEVLVRDSSLIVQPKPGINNSSSQKSLRALVLIVQAAFEMFLAFLISRALGWPPLIIFMVLVANIAAFPLYLFQMPAIFIREIADIFIKGLVMGLVGIRKLSFYKIIILTVLLYVLSFGLKEILFFLVQLI
jgi:hypothetical protein